ncbi:High frequency lysogenization protein HflD [hydrothermal vent metagenome]|uniref:High frequency lysogenization protein HflD n=1 Tax=hydrothermal vent metagenome TaxID=652676 RepID=A0A3B1C772_9ZZZZ
MSSTRERTLALAGMFQAASLVKAVATNSEVNNSDIEVTLETLFVTSPESTLEVYGCVDNLYVGLHALIQQLGGNGQRDIDIARYVISLLHLCNKLMKNDNMMAQLSKGIENARTQRTHFPLLHENVIANLAGIYTDTISQLQPKIMVTGDSQHLSNNTNTNMVRALLLAGMRSAVLWRQLKGSRWQVLLQRKRFVQEAEYLLKEKIVRH